MGFRPTAIISLHENLLTELKLLNYQRLSKRNLTERQGVSKIKATKTDYVLQCTLPRRKLCIGTGQGCTITITKILVKATVEKKIVIKQRIFFFKIKF